MTQDNRKSEKRLANAARIEFARFGYAGARTERIARQAGVNKQLLFYYFGSKAGLYAAVIRDAEAELASALQPDPGQVHHPGAQLRRTLVRAYDVLGRREELVRVLAEGTEDTDPSLPAAQRWLTSLRSQLEREISAGQGVGYFRDDADPATAASLALSVLVGLALLTARGEGGPAPEGRAVQAESVVGLVLRSLGW